jgi:hypothetical protein
MVPRRQKRIGRGEVWSPVARLARHVIRSRLWRNEVIELTSSIVALIPRTREILVLWGRGSTAAEEMACDLLHAEEYEDVDPIHPYGGPDGSKDILCRKNGILCVAAVYFPNNSNTVSFKDLEAKYLHDLKGVARNAAAGFLFFTNVKVTDGKRDALGQHAIAEHCLVSQVYHLDRIRGLLDDSGKCFLIRRRHLGIEITQEEIVDVMTRIQNRQEQLAAAARAQFENAHREQMDEVNALTAMLRTVLKDSEQTAPVADPTAVPQGAGESGDSDGR